MTRWFAKGRTLAVLAALFLVPAGLAGAQQHTDPLNGVNTRAGFSSVDRAYPQMNARYARKGTPRDIATVRSVAVGQSQTEVEALLGKPASRNSDGSREFNLSLPLNQRDRLICQYRVFFDGAGTVERAVWRRHQCADLVLGRLH